MTVPIFIAGHSLGGARAFQYAYSRIKRGLRVDGIYALASPNPGDKAIGQILFANRAGMTIRSLKNRRDLVTDVPVDIVLIGEEYVQPWTFDEINEPPVGNDYDPIFADHHIGLYQAGARKVPDNPGVAVSLADAADQIARLYQTDEGWDWINPTNGAYWAMKVMPSGARLMIPRGTVTVREWMQDLDAAQTFVLGAKMSRGFWQGVAAIEPELDRVLAA